MAMLQLLRQLQLTDQEWDEKLRLYQTVTQRLADQSEAEARREAQRQQQHRLAMVRSSLRDAELELASLQQRAQEIETDLYSGRIRAPKELEGLRQDGEVLRKRIALLEERALIAMTEMDDLEIAVRQGEEELRAFEQHWAEERTLLAEQHKTLQVRLQQLQGMREQVRHSLGRAELALYDQLRAKKAGVALASMKDGVCQTCWVAVPSLKAQLAQIGEEIATCEGCGRILYLAS